MDNLKKLLDCAIGLSEDETNKYTLLVTNYYFYLIEPELPETIGEAYSMFMLAKMIIDRRNPKRSIQEIEEIEAFTDISYKMVSKFTATECNNIAYSFLKLFQESRKEIYLEFAKSILEEVYCANGE